MKITFKSDIKHILSTLSLVYLSPYAHQQLDALFIHTCCLLVTHALRIVNNGKSNTLSISHIANATRILFTGELCTNLLIQGDKIINETTHPITPIISVSTMSTLLSFIVPRKIHIASKCAWYIAYVMEYFCVELLDLTLSQTFLNHRDYITPHDLYMGIQIDSELKHFYTSNSFMILNQYPEHEKNLLLPTHPFTEIIREITTQIEHEPIKISKPCFNTLQYYIEQYVIKILKKSNHVCQYNGRSKLTGNDIQFVIDNLN